MINLFTSNEVSNWPTEMLLCSTVNVSKNKIEKFIFVVRLAATHYRSGFYIKTNVVLHIKFCIFSPSYSKVLNW